MDPSDSSRLSALHRYSTIDAPPEPNFDRITHLAATILDLPYCSLNLADAERRWIKPHFGASAIQIPRRTPFCDETIRGDRVFVVADARTDFRFASTPHVAGPPYLRFYAGAPLISSKGSRIGSLCVLDVRPRSDFGDREANVLSNLAQTAAELLEARSRQIALAELTEQIAHLARHDPLTGLANRRLLREHMEQAMAGNRQNEQTAVLYLDLDRFKKVNDSLGHQAGDALLRQVADRLRQTVHGAARVARLGGDEFAIVQTGPEASRRAADLADRIIAAVSAPYEIEGWRITISASVGIALGASASGHPDQLFRDADSALSSAKSAGRGRRVFYEAAMRRGADLQARQASAPAAWPENISASPS